MSRRARRAADEEDESYFISLSDLMAGVLFLFIIMLTYFGLELRKSADGIATRRVAAAPKARPVVVAPPQPAAPPIDLRTALLERLDVSLQAINSPVKVDVAAGELTVPNTLLFQGSDALTPAGAQALSGLAGALAQVLPCAAASTGLPPPSDCPTAGGRLTALSIEGHAVGGGDTLTRSAVQAAAVYRQLIAAQPNLQTLRADPAGGGPPVVSVAAFASGASVGDAVEIKMGTSGP